MIRVSSMFVCLMVFLSPLVARELQVYSEFQRPDPFGKIVEADQIKASTLPAKGKTAASIELKGARGGYVSFQLAVQPPKGGSYSLTCDFAAAGSNVQVDLFKAWFHRLQKDGRYIPDALIPVQNPFPGELPDPDNQIKDQTSQAFWVDLYIPREAKPGLYPGRLLLRSGQTQALVKVRLEILDALIPPEDVVVVDHPARLLQ